MSARSSPTASQFIVIWSTEFISEIHPRFIRDVYFVLEEKERERESFIAEHYGVFRIKFDRFLSGTPSKAFILSILVRYRLAIKRFQASSPKRRNCFESTLFGRQGFFKAGKFDQD